MLLARLHHLGAGDRPESGEVRGRMPSNVSTLYSITTCSRKAEADRDGTDKNGDTRRLASAFAVTRRTAAAKVD